MEEVPRRTSLVPLASPCFALILIGVETEGFLDYQGRAGDHFHCVVELSPGHSRCRVIPGEKKHINMNFLLWLTSRWPGTNGVPGLTGPKVYVFASKHRKYKLLPLVNRRVVPALFRLSKSLAVQSLCAFSCPSNAFAASGISNRAPGLIQLVLIVLVFCCRVRLVPGSQLRLGA